MVRVVFRNLGRSEFLKDAIHQKINHVLEKFPGAQAGTVATVVAGPDHSPRHAGPELFHVKLVLLARGLQPIVLEKTGENLYQAIAQLTDRLFEVLHRALERRREKARSDRRRWKGSRPQRLSFST